jgi:hypothetical protein
MVRSRALRGVSNHKARDAPRAAYSAGTYLPFFTVRTMRERSSRP